MKKCMVTGLLALGVTVSSVNPVWAQSGDSSWASSVSHKSAEVIQGGGSPTLAATPTPHYIQLRPVANVGPQNIAY